MKSILGISAYYHDSAACLVQDGQIVAAAQEERFTRKKHDAGFPSHAVEYCLSQGGVAIGEVDYLVFYDKPLIKFERLLETYLSYAPQGIRSFLTAIPVWIKEKLFLRNLLDKALREVGGLGENMMLSLPCFLVNIMNPMRPRRFSLRPFRKPSYSVWMELGNGRPHLRGSDVITN